MITDPDVSRTLARGLAVADLDPEARAAIVKSYEDATTVEELSDEAKAVLQQGEDAKATAAAIEEVEAALKPLPLKIVCWAAADPEMFPPDGDPGAFVKNTFTYPGFPSVTTDRSKVQVPEGGWMMAVVIPKDIPALWLADQRELLIARGSTFRVVSFNGSVVKVVVVPDAESAQPTPSPKPT